MTTPNKDESQKQNAVSQKPLHFYARHMQPGVCGYENEVVLVDTDAMKKLIPSGMGIPVYIGHQKVEYSTMKEKACGYVVESFYNELDGWAWFKFIAIDDEARAAIAKGWKVSNAYVPSEWGVGGKKNNCDYHREVLNATFTHLAIVPDPRYEEADIMTSDEFKAYQESKKRELAELKNSLPSSKGKTMFKGFKFFKTEKKEVTEPDMDTTVELTNDKGEVITVTLGEMVNAVKKNAEDEKKKADEGKDDKKSEMANGDQMIDIDGEIMPIRELANRYKKLNEKKNADDDDAKKKADEEKANSEKEAADKAEKEKAEKEKTNAMSDGTDMKHFEELRNAHKQAVKSAPRIIETGSQQLQRGKEMFSFSKD